MTQIVDAVGNLHDTEGKFAGHIQGEVDTTSVLGTPVGGPGRVEGDPSRARFEERLAPDDDLHPAIGETDRGVTPIDNTCVVHEEPIEGENGRVLTRRSWNVFGEADLRTRNRAAAVLIAESEDPDTILNKIEELARSRSEMTLMMCDQSGSVTAYEGRPIRIDWSHGEPQLVWQRKGGRGVADSMLRLSNAIAVQRGFGGAQGCADRLADVRSRCVPRVEKITDFADLPVRDFDAEEDISPKVAAVYMFDYGFSQSSQMPGCLFFATDVQPGDGPNEDDIVNGYFWAPDRTAATMNADSLTPEHGSFYGSQLKRSGGKVADYEPGSMTFRDCLFNTIPDDRAEAYRRVMGVSHYRDECGKGRW